MSSSYNVLYYTVFTVNPEEPNNLLHSRPTQSTFLPDILRPYAHIDGFFLIRTFVQKQIVDPFEFIYSPSSLQNFLVSLDCLNASGALISYRTVHAWNLDYHGRPDKISEYKTPNCGRGVANRKNDLYLDSLNYLNNGGDKKLKSLLFRYYENAHFSSESCFDNSLKISHVSDENFLINANRSKGWQW